MLNFSVNFIRICINYYKFCLKMGNEPVKAPEKTVKGKFEFKPQNKSENSAER